MSELPTPVEATTAEPEPVEQTDPEPCPGCPHLHFDNRCCRCGKPEHKLPRFAP
jgi:hypothetical protein